jgi:hypothetical protein
MATQPVLDEGTRGVMLPPRVDSERPLELAGLMCTTARSPRLKIPKRMPMPQLLEAVSGSS